MTSIKDSEALKQELTMKLLSTMPFLPAGEIVATPGALALLEQANKTPAQFLSRHLCGDWADALGPDDHAENALSLTQGFRLFSIYTVQAAETPWILPEADGYATPPHLPTPSH